jgi:hypothetical protein
LGQWQRQETGQPAKAESDVAIHSHANPIVSAGIVSDLEFQEEEEDLLLLMESDVGAQQQQQLSLAGKLMQLSSSGLNMGYNVPLQQGLGSAALADSSFLQPQWQLEGQQLQQRGSSFPVSGAPFAFPHMPRGMGLTAVCSSHSPSSLDQGMVLGGSTMEGSLLGKFNCSTWLW